MSRSSGTDACRSTTGRPSGRSWPVADRSSLREGVRILPPRRRATPDTRGVEPGSLFVAIPGSRVDGTEFVEEAFGKGALAAIVPEEGTGKIPPSLLAEKPVFVVRNPVEALGDLAKAHRMRYREIPLVGITGSSGKTSTKEMLAALLSSGKRVLRNPGNRNNLIGMPLALLTLSAEHD